MLSENLLAGGGTVNDRKTGPVPAVGAGALMTVFGVLCLTVFALLSLSTVQAQTRLAEKSREAVEGYYEADCQAERILSQLRRGQIPQGIRAEGDIYTYACRISDTQALLVRVRLANGEYEILLWEAVATVQWQADEKLPVWEGNAS